MSTIIVSAGVFFVGFALADGDGEALPDCAGALGEALGVLLVPHAISDIAIARKRMIDRIPFAFFI